MPVDATIEERLAAVEAAVAELRSHILIQQPAPDWLEQVIGSFKDGVWLVSLALVGEFAPDKARGKLLGFTQVAWCLGPSVVLWLALALASLGLLGIRIVFLHDWARCRIQYSERVSRCCILQDDLPLVIPCHDQCAAGAEYGAEQAMCIAELPPGRSLCRRTPQENRTATISG